MFVFRDATPSVSLTAVLLVVYCSNLTPDMTAELIKIAAVKPEERFSTLLAPGPSNIINVLNQVPGFGMSGIENRPIELQAIMLPNAKIRYAGNKSVDPGLAGQWFQTAHKFVTMPPVPHPTAGYRYAVMVVVGHRDRGVDGRTKDQITQFFKDFDREAASVGVKLTNGGSMLEVEDDRGEIANKVNMLKNAGARLAFVVMTSPDGDSYGRIKLAADPCGFPTQCLKLRRVCEPPKGYHTNVMLKVNTKLGGTNHTLTSRLAPNTTPPKGYQDPPKSLSWVFEKPSMMVGIDVSHPDRGRSEGQSLAAVVGSVNRSCSQYIAHIRSQAAGQEIVSTLCEAMETLFDSFRRKNGCMPAHVLVYRDGVGDGQFAEVLQDELGQIQEAVRRQGSGPEDVKISIVVCQKRHSTRLVYRGEGSDVENLCPGIVADASQGDDSISSANHIEFYLNSHISIQGTAKPCKYSLIHDEIGFKLSELELLTYWTCYLYCRCNRSVSLATPAYYAHWASKRARILFRAGATPDDLVEISKAWSADNALATMFFV